MKVCRQRPYMHKCITPWWHSAQIRARPHGEGNWCDVCVSGAALKWNYGPEGENFPSQCGNIYWNMALTSRSVMFFFLSFLHFQKKKKWNESKFERVSLKEKSGSSGRGKGAAARELRGVRDNFGPVSRSREAAARATFFFFLLPQRYFGIFVACQMCARPTCD